MSPLTQPGIKVDAKVLALAQKLANQQMRVEILPLLKLRHPRPNSWNPLRVNFQGRSPYHMKLWLPDKLAMLILQDDKLMDKTEQIVTEAVMDAATIEARAFVLSLFESVKDD